MAGSREKKSGAAKRSIDAPYVQLRHAARSDERELQHHDQAGLRGLLDDYFSLADELELESFRPSGTRVKAAPVVGDGLEPESVLEQVPRTDGERATVRGPRAA